LFWPWGNCLFVMLKRLCWFLWIKTCVLSVKTLHQSRLWNDKKLSCLVSQHDWICQMFSFSKCLRFLQQEIDQCKQWALRLHWTSLISKAFFSDFKHTYEEEETGGHVSMMS
jgi:hypothetical protein